MPGGREYPVTLTIKAVDKGALARLRAFSAAMRKIDTEKLQRTGSVLGGLSKSIGLPKLIEGFKGFGGAVKNVAGEAFSLGARIVGMASVAGIALYTIVRGAVDAGDKLAELSDRAKVGVDWFASMRFAAEQADVEQDAFNGSMDHFVKALGDMKAGGGKLLSFLDRVAPKLAEQVKHAKGTEDAFAIMTDAFKRIDDPMKLAALGAATFGKEAGPVMANFLHQGSAAVQKQQLEFLRLAGSQDAFAKSSSDLDNDMRETETAFLGLRSAAAGALFPAFSKLSKAVTEFIVKNRGGIGKWADGAAASITAWVQSGGLERLTTSLGDLASSIGGFIEVVGGFKTIAIAAAAVMAGPLLMAIVGVIPAVYALGVALLTTPVGWFVGAIALIAGGAYLIYKNWEPIKKFFADLWGDFVDSYKSAWEWLKPKLEAMGKFLRKVIDPFGALGTTEDTDTRFLSEEAAARARDRKPVAAYSWGNVRGNNPMPAPLFADASGKPAPPVRPLPPTGGDSRVTVDFKNVPPGTVVRQDRSANPVDLNLGFANP